MLKKLIGVVAVTTMALLASVTAASAQAYPPPPNDIRCLNDADLVFVQGGDAVFDARTFMGGSSVTWTLFSAPVVLGTTTADAEGVATITTNIPLDAAVGAHRVEATGVDRFGDALTLVLDITVVSAQGLPSEDPPGSSGGPLPRTGSSSSVPMAQIAVATIVAGGFLLIMANKRRADVVPVTTQQPSTKV
jgi:hypothetical protein